MAGGNIGSADLDSQPIGKRKRKDGTVEGMDDEEVKEDFEADLDED